MASDRFAFLDPNLRKEETSKHPHESTHTIREVTDWLDQTGLKFVKSIPKTNGRSFSPAERLFAPEPAGTRVQQAVAEGAMILSGSQEGGFFIVIAQKP